MLAGYQEQVFFHYILKNPRFLASTSKEFFSNPNVKLIFDIAKEHALRYKEEPSKEQTLELVRIKGFEESLSDDIITALYNSKVQLQEYDEEWLSENVGSWIQIRNVELAIRKAIAYLKTSNVTTENASEIVETIKHMITTDMSIDFTFQLGTDFFDPKSHLQTRLARTTSGYPYIDKCLKGGWWKGSLICFLSGPKAGKSLWLQNLAAHSVLNGHNTAYMTFELQEELVHMRLGSNMLSINIDSYEEKIKDQDWLRKKLNDLKAGFVPPGELTVKEFPSGAKSVNDIRAHLVKEQEMKGIKFENVFVDYINLIKNWRNPNSENLYIKIKQIAEDLRAMAMEEGWAVITVTQTNKSGWEGSDMQISNVSESAALIMTVDALFGIITTPEMKARGEYMLKYMADRVSGMENTRKKFNVDFKLSRIEEDLQTQIEDLDYVVVQTVGGSKPNRGRETSKDITIQKDGNIPELDLSNNSLFPDTNGDK